MHRLVRCAGLLFLALALSVPASVGQEKENPAKKEGEGKKDVGKKKDDPDEKGKKEKFTWGHEFTAKLTKLETGSEKKEFTVQVSQKITEINPDVQRQITQHQATLAQQQD